MAYREGAYQAPCAACDRSATDACRCCGRPYCEEHARTLRLGPGRFCAPCFEQFARWKRRKIVLAVAAAVLALVGVAAVGQLGGLASFGAVIGGAFLGLVALVFAFFFFLTQGRRQRSVLLERREIDTDAVDEISDIALLNRLDEWMAERYRRRCGGPGVSGNG